LTRFPRGYRGINHETIGTDILALLGSILMPEPILGPALTARLKAVKPTAWYPIADLLEPLEELDRKLNPDSLRKVGRTLFSLSHEEQFRKTATSARDVVHGIDRLYRAANRGTDIGGWSVVSFEPGKAILEKTTPHNCIMEEGILEAGLRVLNIPALIHQTSCFRAGAEACRFSITSHVTDARWSGKNSSSSAPATGSRQ
jgi:hypothetical protein